jgi:hypothetical protein
VFDGPFIAVVKESVAQAESIDLLLDLLECQFVVVLHSKIFLDGIILAHVTTNVRSLHII